MFQWLTLVRKTRSSVEMVRVKVMMNVSISNKTNSENAVVTSNDWRRGFGVGWIALLEPSVIWRPKKWDLPLYMFHPTASRSRRTKKGRKDGL